MASDERAPGHEWEEAQLSRRDVIGIGLVAGVGLAAGGLPIARYLAPSALGGGASDAEIPIDRLVVWQAERVLVRGAPIYVVRTPDEILGCSAICTHLGCITRWNRTQRIFFCPCHGARFAPDGRVLGGPAPSPLPRYEIAVRHGKVRIGEPT
jgi:cytochrome b6-f complex iron-sulfur subunit